MDPDAWRFEPSPRSPRRQLAGGAGSRTSAHEGAANFGAGCMMAIRNIVTHNLPTPDEADAVQQLAALSVLATWVDQARLAGAEVTPAE